jgi:uncharacterized membrane protein YdfJ with MMPL/SSD domain
VFAGWGSRVARLRWPVLIVALIAVIGSGVWGFGVFGQLTEGGYNDPRSESARAAEMAATATGGQGGDVIAVYTPDQGTIDDAALTKRIKERLGALPKTAVESQTSYWDRKAAAYASEDKTSAVAVITLTGDDDAAKMDAYADIDDALTVPGAHVELAGGIPLAHASSQRSTDDLAVAEMVSLPIVLILLLLIFGSLVAASLPVLVGGAAVLGSLGVLHAVALTHEVNSFAVNVASLLGLGMAIDYGLFMVGRFREEQAVHHTAEAVRRTVATAGRTVVFSATLLMTALAGLLLFPQGFLKSLAYGGLAAVFLAMLLSLTLLPALLAVLGPRVDLIPIRLPGRGRAATSTGGWERLAGWVLRRPVLVAVPIFAALVVLALPIADARFGENDERQLPAGDPSRVAIETLKSDYPQFGSDGVQVVVHATNGKKPDVKAFSTAAAKVTGVDKVTAAGGNNADIVLLTAHLTSTDVFSDEARDAVDALRALPPPAGAELLVGGVTARNVDSLEAIGAELPRMIGLLAGATLVLMFLAFGSILLPIKAVVMSALSLTATFGSLVWIFQEGHGASWLNVTPTPLEAGIVVLMAAVVFGLSTDYEVFLLSRMVEARLRGATTREAVTIGLSRTGRVISAAALLLIVVTGAFALSSVTTMRFIGVGMIIALVLDATVVRVLLVPAVLAVLGDASWWAPGPLRRLQEKAGLAEYAGEEEATGRHAWRPLDPSLEETTVLDGTLLARALPAAPAQAALTSGSETSNTVVLDYEAVLDYLSEKNLSSGTPSDDRPHHEAPASPAEPDSLAAPDTSVSGAPVSAVPASGAPASSAPTSGAPVSGAPVSGIPASSAAVSGAPASGAPVSGVPASEAPVSGAPVPGTPVSGAPTSGTPVSGTPVSSAASGSAGDSVDDETIDADDLWAEVEATLAAGAEATRPGSEPSLLETYLVEADDPDPAATQVLRLPGDQAPEDPADTQVMRLPGPEEPVIFSETVYNGLFTDETVRAATPAPEPAAVTTDEDLATSADLESADATSGDSPSAEDISAEADAAQAGILADDVPLTEVSATDVRPIDAALTDVSSTGIRSDDATLTDVSPTDVAAVDVAPADVPATDVPFTASASIATESDAASPQATAIGSTTTDLPDTGRAPVEKPSAEDEEVAYFLAPFVDPETSPVAPLFEPVAPSTDSAASPFEPVAPSSEFTAHPYDPVAPSTEFAARSYDPVAPSAEYTPHPYETAAPSAEYPAHPYEPVASSAEFAAHPYEPVVPPAETAAHPYRPEASSPETTAHPYRPEVSSTEVGAHRYGPELPSAEPAPRHLADAATPASGSLADAAGAEPVTDPFSWRDDPRLAAFTAPEPDSFPWLDRYAAMPGTSEPTSATPETAIPALATPDTALPTPATPDAFLSAPATADAFLSARATPDAALSASAPGRTAPQRPQTLDDWLTTAPPRSRPEQRQSASTDVPDTMASLASSGEPPVSLPQTLADLPATPVSPAGRHRPASLADLPARAAGINTPSPATADLTDSSEPAAAEPPFSEPPFSEPAASEPRTGETTTSETTVVEPPAGKATSVDPTVAGTEIATPVTPTSDAPEAPAESAASPVADDQFPTTSADERFKPTGVDDPFLTTAVGEQITPTTADEQFLTNSADTALTPSAADERYTTSVSTGIETSEPVPFTVGATSDNPTSDAPDQIAAVERPTAFADTVVEPAANQPAEFTGLDPAEPAEPAAVTEVTEPAEATEATNSADVTAAASVAAVTEPAEVADPIEVADVTGPAETTEAEVAEVAEPTKDAEDDTVGDVNEITEDTKAEAYAVADASEVAELADVVNPADATGPADVDAWRDPAVLAQSAVGSHTANLQPTSGAPVTSEPTSAPEAIDEQADKPAPPASKTDPTVIPPVSTSEAIEDPVDELPHEPTLTTEATEPAEAAESAETAEPAMPTEPAEPTTAADPSTAPEPTDTVEPTDTPKAADPIETIDEPSPIEIPDAWTATEAPAATETTTPTDTPETTKPAIPTTPEPSVTATPAPPTVPTGIPRRPQTLDDWLTTPTPLHRPRTLEDLSAAARPQAHPDETTTATGRDVPPARPQTLGEVNLGAWPGSAEQPAETDRNEPEFSRGRRPETLDDRLRGTVRPATLADHLPGQGRSARLPANTGPSWAEGSGEHPYDRQTRRPASLADHPGPARPGPEPTAEEPGPDAAH